MLALPCGCYRLELVDDGVACVSLYFGVVKSWRCA